MFQGQANSGNTSTSSDDLDDLQPVARIELAAGEFRRGNGLPIMLDYYAAREESLRDQELLDRAGELALDALSIGN